MGILFNSKQFGKVQKENCDLEFYKQYQTHKDSLTKYFIESFIKIYESSFPERTIINWKQQFTQENAHLNQRKYVINAFQTITETMKNQNYVYYYIRFYAMEYRNNLMKYTITVNYDLINEAKTIIKQHKLLKTSVKETLITNNLSNNLMAEVFAKYFILSVRTHMKNFLHKIIQILSKECALDVRI